LVIEGYPRSANTFAYCAFKFVNPNVKIAHHLHLPFQIIQAVKLNIPAIVLIREPKDAIISRMIRNPYLSNKSYIIEYIKFYKALLKHKDKIVVARFADIINNFPTIIEKTNKKFKTDFNIFEQSNENIKKIFHEIENLDKMDNKSDLVNKLTVSLPKDKEEYKREKEAILKDVKLLQHIRTAQEIYLSFIK